MKAFFRILSLITALTIIAVCCGCENKHSNAYIYFELPQKPETLDPQTASSDSELLITRNIFEGLLRKDKSGTPVCAAAKSFTKNGLVYTFEVRDDAKWSNGDDVTAEDFLFGLQRAVSPQTKSPFVYRLFCIKNAEAVYSANADVNSLGVKVLNSKKLQIELSFDDAGFEETLTTPICMPCNKSFFEKSVGKYGLSREYIISNGSYRLTKWNKEDFGIRLYRNENCKSDFKAKNGAVFLTCNTKDETVISMLKSNKIDGAFLPPFDVDEALKIGIKTQSFENICWFLTFSDEIPLDMRKAFCMTINTKITSQNSLYRAANSIYPAEIAGGNNDVCNVGILEYNYEAAKELYNNSLNTLSNGKLQSDMALKYENKQNAKEIVTSIAGHWQNKLGAYINIEAQSKTDNLISQLQNTSLPFAFFPVTSKSGTMEEYLRYFSDSYSTSNLENAQSRILNNYNVIPVMFEKTVLGFNDYITEQYTEAGNGYIDFSFIIKND